MAIQHHDEQQSSSFVLDSSLYCEEERWEEEAEEVCQNEILHVICDNNGTRKNPFFFPLSSMLKQDLSWEDGGLLSLFSKEEEEEQSQVSFYNTEENADSCLSIARQQAVEWMLKVNAHYGFSALTAILAVNYLDRFLSSYYQRDKPWMIQLVAVTCLSLAAKVEETQVPLLLDLQVCPIKTLQIHSHSFTVPIS